MVTDHEKNDEWVQEHKIYIRYDDLVETLPGSNLEVRTDIRKIYEVSCKIDKMGEDKMKWQISKKGSHLLSKIENYIIQKEIDLNLID